MEQFSTSQYVASGTPRQPLHAGQRRPVPIRNESGRVVGTVRMVSGRRTFLKTVRPERHQLRHPPAWASDVGALKRAEAAGATAVVLRERGSRRRWWAPLAAFGQFGFAVVRGAGVQVGLTLEHWQLEDPHKSEQVSLFPEAAS